MALTIEEVKIVPHPVPAESGVVRASCRVASDDPIKSVVAYLPAGEAVAFQRQNETTFEAQGYVPPGTLPGTYEVTVVATDDQGNTARKFISITIL